MSDTGEYEQVRIIGDNRPPPYCNALRGHEGEKMNFLNQRTKAGYKPIRGSNEGYN